MRLDHLLSKENYLLFNFEGSFLRILKISTLSNGIYPLALCFSTLKTAYIFSDMTSNL